MADGDVYRRMLAAASHTQQQRHAQLHSPPHNHQYQYGEGASSSYTVGNVFLPALQNRSSAQSALSMKHLEIIEKCILAENRREEQLAKCPSEKEKKFLVKKFQAQRAHERELVQALMIGHVAPKEMEIVDLEATRATYKSPLLASKSSSSCTKDKVIKMVGDKTVATSKSPGTKSTPKPCRHGSAAAATAAAITATPSVVSSVSRLSDSDAMKQEHRGLPAPISPSLPSSPTKVRSLNKAVGGSGSSPQKRDRPSCLSASPTRKQPPLSPPRKQVPPPPLELMKLPAAVVARSPFKPSLSSSSPTKRKKSKPPISGLIGGDDRDQHALPTTFTDGRDHHHEQQQHQEQPVGSIAFDGATSFHEARQHAMAAVQGHKDMVSGGGTQTTDRTYGDVDSDGEDALLAVHNKGEYMLVLTTEAPVVDGHSSGGNGGDQEEKSRRRPHSSPEPRRRRRPSAEAIYTGLPSMAHSELNTKLHSMEIFHASESPTKSVNVGGVISVQSFISQDRGGSMIHVVPKDTVMEFLETQVAWHDTKPVVVEAPVPVALYEEQGEPIHDQELESEDDPKVAGVNEQPGDEGDAVPLTQSVALSEWALEDRGILGDVEEHHDDGGDIDEAIAAGICSEETIAQEDHGLITWETAVDGGHVEEPAESTSTVVGAENVQAKEEDGDHDNDHGVLLALIYDLIHQIEEEEEEMSNNEPRTRLEVSIPIETAVTIEPSLETRRATFFAFNGSVTPIQAAFRGHRSRRAFRLALYQEALQCGVLGAMPNTLQGRSGWYQDPKSFMAYYFVVKPDGEWKQKIVLRCSALILTSHQMHEQILSRVDVAPDEE